MNGGVRRRIVILVGVGVGLLGVPSVAAASHWEVSRPLDDPARETLTPLGSAIGASGRAVVTWAEDRRHGRHEDFETYASVRERGGRFGPAQHLGAGDPASVAVGADGSITAVWPDAEDHELRVARALPGRPFTAAKHLVLGTDVEAVVPRGRGALVAYTGAGGLRTVRLDGLGRRSAPVVVGPIAEDVAGTSPAGDLVVCCLVSRPAVDASSVVVLVARAGAGVLHPLPVSVPERAVPGSVAIDETGRVSLAVTQARSFTDDVDIGPPALLVGVAGDVPTLLRALPAAQHARAYDPQTSLEPAAPPLLAWRQQPRPHPVFPAAPLRVTVGGGAPETVGAADEGPLLDGRLLTWTLGRRLRMAAREGAAVVPIAAPPAPLSIFSDWSVDHAGHEYLVAWDDRAGRVRAALRRLG